MPSPGSRRFLRRQSLLNCLLLSSLLAISACKQTTKADIEQQNQADMWLSSVPDLKPLNVSNAEIGELQKAHDAGLTDPGSVTLIKLARSRNQPFKEGQPAADLLAAGSSEQTVLELSQLNQLGPLGGQAQALRLAGLSDKVILAVAQRHAQGLPVLSGEKLGELKNSGANEAAILDMIVKGATEQQASNYIAERERAAGGHGFVYQRRSRKR
jgi:hypothetical protein